MAIYTKISKNNIASIERKFNLGKIISFKGIKKGIDEKVWYPEWDSKERWAAQRALNNALDVLDEYDY